MKLPTPETDFELNYNQLGTLKHLATEGAIDERVLLTGADLERGLSVSMQTVSRRLQHLEDAGLIERKVVSAGQRLTITAKGVDVLKREHDIYRDIFDRDVVLSGVATRDARAWDHILQRDVVREELGYDADASTVSISLTGETACAQSRLHGVEPVATVDRAESVPADGDVDVYEASAQTDDRGVDGVHAAHVPDDQATLGLVAPEDLRTELGIEPETEVRIRVH